MMSMPLNAQSNSSYFEDDADFVATPSATSGVTSWSADSEDTTTATFEECSVPGVCRTYKVTGGNYAAVITNTVTGKTINVPMGDTFEAPVFHVQDGALVAGVEYRITADVGQWIHFCYPETRTVMFGPEDNNREIKIEIPCE
jgi:hypothetical protein